MSASTMVPYFEAQACMQMEKVQCFFIFLVSRTSFDRHGLPVGEVICFQRPRGGAPRVAGVQPEDLVQSMANARVYNIREEDG